MSAHLHLWVDLIFGHKQRGQAAVDATNVFHHLTYEGSVDLSAISSDRQRLAIESQVRFFGQTPMQLFRRPHPARDPRSTPIAAPQRPLSERRKLAVSGFEAKVNSEGVAVSYVVAVDGLIVTVDAMRFMRTHKIIKPVVQAGSFAFASPSAYCIEEDGRPGRRIGTPFAMRVRPAPATFALVRELGRAAIVSVGHWDHALRVTSAADGKAIAAILKHKAAVSCVCACAGIVVTGSSDTSVVVWSVGSSPGGGLVIGSLHVIHGHMHPITCVDADVSLDVVASGSSAVLINSMRTGAYLCAVKPPSGVAADGVTATHVKVCGDLGLVVVYWSTFMLGTYSLNGGACVSGVEMDERAVDVTVVPDCGVVIAATARGNIVVRDVLHLPTVLLSVSLGGLGGATASVGVRPSITSLCASVDGDLLVVVGTDAGGVVLITLETERTQ